MSQIRKAIYDKFTSLTGGIHNTFYTSISGNLYYEHVPQGSAYPYAIFYFLGDRNEWTFREKFDYYTVQFNIVSSSSSPSEAETIYDYLIELFDDATLSATGYTHIWCVREVSSGPMWFLEEGVWQISIRYSILFQDT